jgi:AbrB family looped-hinge helix DNA binding protein
MKTIDAKVTSQGQVTIPAEVRRRLGVEKGALISFIVDENGVRIEPARFTLESVFGSVPAIPGTSEDFDEEIDQAWSDEIDRKVRSRDEAGA